MEISREISRQIGIIVNRRGVVEYVIVGDRERIHIPVLSSERVGRARFRGLRLVHTHLDSELLSKEDLTDLALLQLDLVACILERSGEPVELIQIGYLIPSNRKGQVWDFIGPEPVNELDLNFTEFITDLEAEFVKERGTSYVTRAAALEECVLVIVVLPRRTKNVEERIAELKDLSYSAGLSVLDVVVQRPKELHPRFLVGKGKIEEIAMRSRQLGAGMLVFDEELTPSQLNSISSLTELKVIDRNQLILDIFAARAKTGEAKIQVELAQLRYILPRLAEKEAALSRLTGGIGGRGPGETKLEVNRRRIKEKIAFLEKKLKDVGKIRERKRERRRGTGIPIVSIVGYTNSGKSTLLNLLTKSTVEVQERFFSTLTPTTRLIKYPVRKQIVLTDTVGFIEDLPEVLLRAFAATLEELEDATLLLHLVDISSPDFEERIATVNSVIDALGLSEKKKLLVFNKIDRVDRKFMKILESRYSAVSISCVTEEGIGKLVETMEIMARATSRGQRRTPPAFQETGG
ncbi:MAG: GTPase HflX [Syntrophorhabdaceae bacterium PtaU1.Bin034]|nr:MAG: GTPase HflX [Syntrophorhabdaceae bacterium PtaU1.Bin034]